MASRVLRKSEWHSYFERVSRGLFGERAEIKVSGLTLDHLIREPREISVNDGPDGMESMEIVDTDRRKQIVELVKPLQTPRRVIE